MQKYPMVDPKKLKFKNITISGLPGSGSSTLGRGLSEVLGWEYFSGGDFMRSYAIKKGLFDAENRVHHAATVYGNEFDREVDYGMRKRLKEEEGKILDSWLSGFVAQKVSGVLKVLAYCTNDDIRVDRLVNRDKVSVEEAKKHIFEREKKNLTKWTKMYKAEWEKWVPEKCRNYRKRGWLDFYHPDLYDVAIDTYSVDRERALGQVLEKLGYKAKV